jgi:hypothetical protein
MHIFKNKTKAILIALFLILTITVFATPKADAARDYYTTWLYVATNHQSIGVGQQILLVAWTASMPPDIGESSGLVASPNGRAGWDGMKVTVTRPDGTNETLDYPHSDPVGANWVTYSPLDVGNYSFQAFFPSTWKNTTTNQYYYSSAISNIGTFTAQQEPIQPWQETPLPTDYWTRPLYSANRGWYILAGDWLGTASGAQNVGPTSRFGYGKGPETAHIMWTKPYYAGGIMDARFDDVGYQTTHYQGLTFEPIIMNGKIYYNARDTAHGSQGSYAVDLYTGETLFYINKTLSFGQIYNYDSPNQHGGFAYLWRTSGATINNPGGVNGTIWEMLDGVTGNSICKIANVTSGGTAVYGKDGSILRYNLVTLGTTAAPKYYLQVWNSSATPSELLGDTGTNYWQWRPGTGGRGQLLGGEYVHDGSKGFSLNVSIPSILAPTNTRANQTGTIRAVREDDLVIIGTTGLNDERGLAPGWLMAVSLKQGQEGTKLWDITYTPPSSTGNRTITLVHVDPDDGIFLFSDRMERRWYGYSLETGKSIWTGEPEPAYHYFGMNSFIYQGMLFCQGDGMAAGELIAYNVTTGTVLWKYTPAQVGFESPYGNYPISVTCIADGKIYLSSGEHSPTQPLWRGSYLRCINVSNGLELWKILHWAVVQSAGLTQGMVVPGDGYLVGLNFYDNQIYCYGKGPSATTIEAPTTATSAGSTVIIEGTVTDQSPGAANYASKFGLKSGVAAVSDASQQTWMEYLYMQQAKPTNATGVPVTIDAIDPNSNYIHIGDATTDASGTFGYAWTTPNVPGQYVIITTFKGSSSYGSSSAQTYAYIVEAEAIASPYPEVVLPPTEMYIVGSTIAIITAIAVVGALLMLKRRT